MRLFSFEDVLELITSNNNITVKNAVEQISAIDAYVDGCNAHSMEAELIEIEGRRCIQVHIVIPENGFECSEFVNLVKELGSVIARYENDNVSVYVMLNADEVE